MLGKLAGVIDALAEQRWLAAHRSIRPTDLVLDVGSGGNPDPRADVLCDRFLDDGTERHGQPLVIDRTFVCGDAHRLPFADKAFDYVILSHVLEHVEDPARVLAEISRVGRRGYIETPSPEFEQVHGHRFHRWLVGTGPDGLTLWPIATRTPPELRNWFRSTLVGLGVADAFWRRRRRLGVFSWLEWEGSVPFRISGTGPIPDAHATLGGSEAPVSVRGAADGGPLWRALQAWSSWLRRRSSTRWSEELLRSPCCLTALERRPEGWECAACQGRYPEHEIGFPMLLREFRRGPDALMPPIGVAAKQMAGSR